MINESPNEKWNRALRFILSDLTNPRQELREEAHAQEFYNEYLWIRDQLIEHAHTLWRNGN